MAATNVLSTLRRSTPSVIECFKNAQLYRRERVSHEQPREMVVLFTWLGAKQKYAHKYANCWTRRGHDVLHVTTSVMDLLFPKSGAEETASRVVDFLGKKDNNVIVHGLSVGGYLTQRVLMDARNSTVHISHQIFDSFTNCVGIEAGVQNAVHPRYRSLAKAGVRLYCKCADLSSINEAQKFALTSPCNAPAMFIHSMADQVSLFPDLEPVISAQEKVSPVTTYMIPKELQVPHVTIMRFLGEHKYMSLIDNFVDKYRGFVSSGSQKDAASVPSDIALESEKVILAL
ncbi:uncharacterized protein [Procambarus clarkii]|uniref:uncharacterized protein isoform X2 n=1 Tax=Procambarus clarkii TaxID=6728 RepID=UPI001E67829E|nr:uncharacterized protein LOC123745393 isoform X2 [Procambarus clarkii]